MTFRKIIFALFGGLMLDHIIATTGSPRTIDEMIRMKAARGR